MDTIDEWMKRVSGNTSNSDSQKQQAKEVRPQFNKPQTQPQRSTQSQQPQSRPQTYPRGQQTQPQRSTQSQQPQSRPQPQKPYGRQQTGPRHHGQQGPRQQGQQGQQGSRHHGQHGGSPHSGSQPHVVRRPQHIRKDKAIAKSKVPKIPKKNLQPTPVLKGKLKIIPLGGLNEVGKNMMAIEYEDDIIIIDMGLEFPSEDLLGIDYVIPDVAYLESNKRRIRGVVITHGHLDHVGGIPYILPKLDFPPVYSAKLTIGLIQKKIEEFKQEKLARLLTIDPDKPLRLGKLLISFFRVSHSIPDALGIVIDTPAGKIVHTGDFKFDETPAHINSRADTHKMEALGHQNVLALFCESTNALKPGHSISEKQVGEVLEKIVREIPGRLIVASFSSQLGRLQQIIEAGVKNKRQIFVSGRSMQENIEIAARLGYLKFPPQTIKDIRQYKKTPDQQTLILTTGSQGEAVSALARIADNEHPHIKIQKGDTIVLSSSPIIGNERAIHTVINNLTILGADVIHNEMMDVHTSGHAKQDELARMINYIKPKYLVPVHGEYYMRKGLAKLATEKCNIPEDKIVMLVNGDVLIAEQGGLKKSEERIETKYILIDGRGEGQVGSQVQIDREIMSENGAVTVLIYVSKKGRKITRPPDIISRGFIYMHESEEITQEIAKIATGAYSRIVEKNPGAERKDIKKYIRQTVDQYTHSKLERRPLIIPLIVEV